MSDMTLWYLLKVAFGLGVTVALSLGAFIAGLAIAASPFLAAYDWLDRKYGKKEPKP